MVKNKIYKTIFDHKIRTFLIIIILGIGGYYGYQKLNPTKTVIQYITQAAEKTTITVSVGGSGQVSELNNLSLTGQGSGKLTTVNFKTGDIVKEGQVIATIDQKSNQVSLDQAKSSLLSAQSDYDTLVKGATESEIKTQQNAIKQAEDFYNNAITDLENKKKSTAEDLKQAQEDLDDLQVTNPNLINNKRDALLSAIQDKLISVRSILDNENKILNDNDLKPTFSAKNISAINNAKSTYDQASPLLSEANSDLLAAQKNKDDFNINAAIKSAIKLLNMTVDSNNYLYIALQNSVPNIDVSQTLIDSYKSSANSQVTSLNSGILAIQTAEQNLIDAKTTAQDNFTSKQNTLTKLKLSVEQELESAQQQIESSLNSWQSAKDKMADLKTPATKDEIQISLSKVKTAKAQLADAQNAFSDNIIKIPFDGKLADVSVQKGDTVGQSTVIATLITTQNIAIIPLNEVDTAKIEMGDKVNLSFDAIDGLTITGKVGQIDTLGTVSQGVVTYNIKISFDTQDDRVKPGMSVSAVIITDVKTDVVAVPNAAIKTDNAGSYVQELDASGQPINVSVVTGLANDSLTEITQGVNEGDKVITQTINSGASTQQTQSTGIRIPGITGGGGNRGGFEAH